MHIRQIRLRNFRRFTDLTIELLGRPELVVLAGPNGSGKSSVFDGLKVWNGVLGGGGGQYSGDPAYVWKGDPEEFQSQPWEQIVQVGFHEATEALSDPREKIYVRTAYRNEADFSVNSIQRMGSPFDAPQPARMIDNDARVSTNYQHLVGLSVDTLYQGEDDQLTVRQVRERYIGELRDAFNAIFPDLILEGPGDPMSSGTFLFRKGTASRFPYMNLSGGEKAVFDLLLDLLVKRSVYENTVFCIDEPEAHLNTAVQADLLGALYGLMNARSQLWVATHSIGMLRRARDLQDADPGRVAFLDFGGHDFDQPVELAPVSVNRAFWERTLSVALGDIAELVAPQCIVLCEGSTEGSPDRRRAFDAQCLRAVFGEDMPDTAFVPVGNDDDVAHDRLGLGRALQALIRGARVIPLLDRDHRSPREAEELVAAGTRVLGRRNLEAFLLDDEVLTALCSHVGKPELAPELLNRKQAYIDERAAQGKDADDMKAIAGRLYVEARRMLQLGGAGNTTDAFMRDTVAPLLRPGMAVYEELRSDIFG